MTVFQKIPRIENAQFYIDCAFQRASKKTSQFTTKKKGKVGLEEIQIEKTIEITRITEANKTVQKLLNSIVKGFPSIKDLPEFYLELLRATLDTGQLKESLGAVQWSVNRIQNIFSETKQKIRQARNMQKIKQQRNVFYGRLASLVKQIGTNLNYLAEARKILVKFPDIKTDVPTVVIAGYPNVGKTTLLKALTGADPEIAPYPFTTKNLMLGYNEGVQYIDTPGLLDRPLAERNPIEKQAVAALKHLAKLVVFVADPTQSCGYSFEKQISLFKELKKLFSEKKFLFVYNKSDLPSEEKAELEKVKTITISAEKGIGIEELMEDIKKAL